MPLDDFLDPAQESRRLKKAQQRAAVHQSPVGGGGDSTHPGVGALSVLLGTDSEADGTSSTAVGPQVLANGDSSSGYGSGAEAAGFRSTAVGASSSAQQDRDSAFGYGATADGGWSVAAGPNATVEAGEGSAFGSGAYVASGHDGSSAFGANSETTAANQVMLGTSSDRVQVPGRLNVTRRTPSGSADTQGAVGDITSDDNYVYVKTSSGWKRSALSTF